MTVPQGKKEVIVIIGGQDSDTLLWCVDSFSPCTHQWHSGAIACFPYALVSHGSVTSGCNELYVAGGVDVSGAESNNVFKYDPTFDSWLEMTPMIIPRSNLGLAVLGGYIYAVGGRDGTRGLHSVECYDLHNNCWQMVAPMMVAVTFPAVVSVGGQLYVMGETANPDLLEGGFDDDATNKVESYDPNKDEWRARVSMKERRHLPGAAVADGQIYVFGGEHSDEVHDTIECYDPDKDSWEVVGKMPFGRRQFSCAVLHLPKETRTKTIFDAGLSHPSCSRHH